MKIQTYKGYFNYALIDEPSYLKTHHFNQQTEEEVQRLQKQFSNFQSYVYYGKIVTEDKTITDETD